MAEPEPSELDQSMAQAMVAGFCDALLASGVATLPGARRPTRVSGDLPSIIEAAEERLEPEQRGELGTDAAQPLQRRGDRVRIGLRGRLDQRVALALDSNELRADPIEPFDLPPDLRLEALRQRPAVPR